VSKLPFKRDFGIWKPTTWTNRKEETFPALQNLPERAPWHDVLGYLETVPVSIEGPMKWTDEADMILAAFWLHGSYAAVLTAGVANPTINDPDISQVDDNEMCRINIEFSAGLAHWLTLRSQNTEHAHRLVLAARTSLSMPWRAHRSDIWEDFQESFTLPEKLIHALHQGIQLQEEQKSPLTKRELANALVNSAYRNGPVENIHAGKLYPSGVHAFGMKRLYSQDIIRIGSKAFRKLVLHLALIENLPDEEMAFYARNPFIRPSEWSLTEETSEVMHIQWPGTILLTERLSKIAKRFPEEYKAENILSTHN